jgi:hypothetical protein
MIQRDIAPIPGVSSQRCGNARDMETRSATHDSWPPVRQTTSGAERNSAAPARPRFKHIIRAWLRRPRAASRQRPRLSCTGLRTGGAAFVRQIDALDVRDTLDVADRLPNLNIPALPHG